MINVRVYKSLLLLAVLFGLGQGVFAKQPYYELDGFTGKQTMMQSVRVGPVDKATLYRGYNYLTFVLSHEKGQSPYLHIQADIEGAGSAHPRANAEGEYLGKPKLYLIVDGSSLEVPIKEVQYLSDFKTLKYTSWDRAHEDHHHRINYYLSLPDGIIEQIASAKSVEGSLRENLPGYEAAHDFALKPKQIRQFSKFLGVIE